MSKHIVTKEMRDAMDLIRAAGGEQIAVKQGAKHTRIHYLIGGEQRVITVSRGRQPPSWHSHRRTRGLIRRAEKISP